MSTDQPAVSSSTLSVLLRMYVPVMLLSLIFPALAGLLVVAVVGHWIAFVVPVLLVLGCGLHLLYLYALSTREIKRERDWFELKLDADYKVKLREFVVEIARQWDTPRPDEIRLSAASAAHVYETKKGKRILVIGGMALAALSCDALAAVVAHELTHFEGGDTTLPWENLTGFTMMQRLGAELRFHWGHFINPAVWPVAAFQFVVETRHAWHSREREFRCDARAARHAGRAAAAAALIYIHVVEEMPWANLMDVLATAAGVGSISTDVFTEQARRAASATFDDWAALTDDELRKSTRLLDTHPCLRERLDAIGIDADDGLAYLLDNDSSSARTLIKDWKGVERKLSVSLASAYQIWREQRYGWGGL